MEADSRYTIHQGDCLDILPTLPAESVQCVVTSPPYYGLRDYGTAQWDGGDPDCDHKVGRFTTPHSEKQGSNGGSGDMQARDVCPRCGAVRVDRQIGLEPTVDEYVARMVDVFRQVRRVLRDDGTVWLNLGDSYALSGGKGVMYGSTFNLNDLPQIRPPRVDGLKPKDLIGIPWRVAFALQADGWWLRSDIIWHKPNPMPESVTDRPTKAHEYVFLLTKAQRYYYDADAVREPLQDSTINRYKYGWNGISDDGSNGARTGSAFQKMKDGATMGEAMGTNGRNKRTVWTVGVGSYSGAHFATMPPDLVEPCIRADSKPGDLILDPFNGSGTTGAVALSLGRQYVGIELNPDYIALAHERIQAAPLPLIAEAL